MKFIIKNEQEIIEGATAKDVAGALRNGSKFASHENLYDYMRGFSKRYEELTGNKVAYNKPQNFVNSLVALGYLEEVRE